MLIEFECSQCGKQMVADERHAGRLAICPDCQKRLSIPGPALVFQAVPQLAPGSHASALRGGSNLIDMETLSPALIEADRSIVGKIDVPEGPWTLGMSRVVTSLAMFFLIWLTAAYVFEYFAKKPDLPPPSIFLIAVNMLLIGIMIALIRRMGDASALVFVAAAVAIVVCMPLNLALGMPLPPPEKLLEGMPQTNTPLNYTLTASDVRTLGFMAFGLVGMLFSIPVWISAFRAAKSARRDGSLS